MGLQHYRGLETPSIREVLLAAVTKCSPSLLGQKEHYHTIFDVTWDLLAFVRDNLGEDEKLSPGHHAHRHTNRLTSVNLRTINRRMLARSRSSIIVVP